MSKKPNTQAAKIPPQSLDAEMSLLGAVLIDDEVLSNVSENLKPYDFYDKRHELIYGAMFRLFERHKPVDLLTLSDELGKKDELELVGGSAYLTELTNYVPTAANAEAYAEIIAQKAVRRRLIKAAGDIAEMSYDEEKNVQEVMETAEANLFAVSDAESKQELVRSPPMLPRVEQLSRKR